MSQHARDTFGNEASREQGRGQGSGQSSNQGLGQDAMPIEQALESAAGGQAAGKNAVDREENLTELRGLATQASNQASNNVTDDDMRAALRQAAKAARGRELHADDERPGALSADDTLHTLEDQGFTEDEAMRLIAVTGRLEGSDEAREAAATLARLRFTRWLVEQGKLDEWSI